MESVVGEGARSRSVLAYRWRNVGLAVVTLALAGCSDDKVARQMTAASGYTEVQTTGYSFFGCDEKDAFHTGFVARGADGSCIEGVVCSGWLKGATLRMTGASNACPVRTGGR